MVRNEPPGAGGVQAQGASTKKERSLANPQVSEGPGQGHQPRSPGCGCLGHPAWPALSSWLAVTLWTLYKHSGIRFILITPDKVGVTIRTYSQKKRGSERWLLAPEWLVSPLTKSGFQSGPFDSRDPTPRGTQRPACLADCSRHRSAHFCKSPRWPPYTSMSSAPGKGTEYHMASSVNS